MLTLSTLGGILLTLGLNEPDPRALVQQLGSARFADRETAAKALRELGRDALPALRASRTARDPEIRNRVQALVGEIETRLMVQPTLVRLDVQDQPLTEVLARLHHLSGIPIRLDPEAQASLANRRITLRDSTPIPFWDAIDRLNRAARTFETLGEDIDAAPAIDSQNTLLLQDIGRQSPGLASNHGPFRVKLVDALFQHRVAFQPRAGFLPGERDSRQLQYQIQVLAEPRMTIGQNGSIRVLEAVDDRGQSLLPPTATLDALPEMPVLYDFNAVASLKLPILLSRPDRPGRTVERLRGVIPLSLSARKPEPVTIPLTNAVGRSFLGEDVALVIHALKHEPNGSESSLDLTVRPLTAVEAGPNPIAGEPEVSHGLDFIEQRIEILDSRGKPFILFPLDVTQKGHEIRLSLMLAPSDGASTPAQLRFYGLTRATTEVPFEFRDIPLP